MTMSDAVHAIGHAVALAERPARLHLAITGPDRAKCLHNLSTNDVKRLPIGRGCEAFVTSLQGKTLAFVTLLALDDRIHLRSESASGPALKAHLAKYAALEDVHVADQSDSTFEFHLLGPAAEDLLHRLATQLPAQHDLAHLTTQIARQAVLIVRESPLGRPGLTLIGRLNNRQALQAALETEAAPGGLPILRPDEVEALRIAAGTPASGLDVTDKNLPQELARDDRAISFVKGCYLGQETVARLDALGHVNRLIRGLSIDADAPPPPGSLLFADSKEAGRISSSALSARTGRPIALAFLRTAHTPAGTPLTVNWPDGTQTPATASDLPIE